MTLLAPGAMALAAALTIPPLVVFYLLKLRRRPLRVTSTMFFEQAAQDLQVNVPFRWIRPSWLLLLHALILACLLIAVGRPAIEGRGTDAGVVYLLIDHSASMSSLDRPGGLTRLDAAKRLAIDEVEDLTAGLDPPEITVIAYAAEPRVMGPPSSSRGTLAAMIGEIGPTDQPADAAAAFALVRSLSATAGPDDDDDTSPPLTIAVTDGGGRIERAVPPGDPVRLVFVEPRPESGRNAGIVSFSAERDVERPEVVRVFLRLLNSGPTEVAAPLVATLDGVPVARTPVSIPAAVAGPGERVATMDIEREAGGLLRVALEHEDVLAADNAVHAVLPPVDRPPVLLVVPRAATPEDPADPRDRADPILLDVLEAIGSAGLRVIDSDRFARATPEDLEAYGLIVFDRATPESAPDRPTLSFGVPWPGLGVQPAIDPAEAGRTPVLSWDRAHPVMRDAVLDTIVVAERLALPEDDAEPRSPRQQRRTLARGRAGPLILALDDAGTPRVVVGFELEQSNWPVHFSFPMFMLAAFDHLAPGSTSGVWSDTASPTTVRLGRAATTLRLDGPASREITFPEGSRATAAPLGVLERVGVYTLTTESGEARQLAVNLVNAEESALPPPPALPESISGPAAARSTEQTEIWRLFILAAAVGLLLEWLLYAARARR